MLLQNLVDDVVESGNSCVVQIVVISESRQLQATLNTFGIHVSINYLLTLPNIQGINKLTMYNLRRIPQNIGESNRKAFDAKRTSNANSQPGRLT